MSTPLERGNFIVMLRPALQGRADQNTAKVPGRERMKRIALLANRDSVKIWLMMTA
jgi:hypothetical protein